VKKVYHPGNWRKILDYGCGTLGDMGIHIFDTPFKSLDLTDPKWVEADCRAPNGFGHAEQNKVHYGFAPTKYTTDNFTFTWWDGIGAPRHEDNPDLQMPNGDKLPKQGALFVGEAGRMVLPHCSMPTFYPDSVLKDVAKPDLGSVDHYTQFLDAIEGKGKTAAGFDYAGPLAEALCLGTRGRCASPITPQPIRCSKGNIGRSDRRQTNRGIHGWHGWLFTNTGDHTLVRAEGLELGKNHEGAHTF
jgi:hypothetical protein